MLKEAEIATKQNDLRTLCKTIMKLIETGNTITVHLKNKDGKILKNEKEIVTKWVEYFREVYVQNETKQEVEEEKKNRRRFKYTNNKFHS